MPRKRSARTLLALLIMAASLVVTGVGLTNGPPAGAATATGPACTFNGGTLLLTGVSNGEQITINCTGLSPLHPYLVMETSLLLGIDPKAAPLLSGDITSVSGLLALLNALPEINPAALTFPSSNLSGDLTEKYTLPATQAPDPNAICPPTAAQIDAGLIGCGLAMIDLTTFKTVPAGSALLEYVDDPFLPPNPTLALSTKKAAPGQSVTVSDAPGATTYWWLSTLSALGALLGGGSTQAPTLTVTLAKGKSSVSAANNVSVVPAVYNSPVLTPPTIEGGFTVPNGIKGKQVVTVTYKAALLSFNLANFASSHLIVQK